MTEAELQARVTGLCDDLGLYWRHDHAPLRNKAGWPDLEIFGRGGGLFPAVRYVELKAADGRRSRAQVECALIIQRAGLVYRLWRPADWDEGIIRKDLEELTS